MWGGVLAAAGWEPWAIGGTFAATVIGHMVVYAKTRQETNATASAAGAQAGTEMATLAFTSLREQAEQATVAARECEGRCDQLAEENRRLRRENDSLRVELASLKRSFTRQIERLEARLAQHGSPPP